jgi:hypothetical protein
MTDKKRWKVVCVILGGILLCLAAPKILRRLAR